MIAERKAGVYAGPRYRSNASLTPRYTDDAQRYARYTDLLA